MRGLKRAAATIIEKRYIRKCSLVSVVNDLIGDWYAKDIWIPQPIPLPNLPEVKDSPHELARVVQHGPSEMLYIHTGHLNKGRNIPVILDAFRSSKHHVVFLGDGLYRNNVVKASREHRNIHWVPPVAADTVVSHIERPMPDCA